MIVNIFVISLEKLPREFTSCFPPLVPKPQTVILLEQEHGLKISWSELQAFLSVFFTERKFSLVLRSAIHRSKDCVPTTVTAIIKRGLYYLSWTIHA